MSQFKAESDVLIQTTRASRISETPLLSLTRTLPPTIILRKTTPRTFAHVSVMGKWTSPKDGVIMSRTCAQGQRLYVSSPI